MSTKASALTEQELLARLKVRYTEDGGNGARDPGWMSAFDVALDAAASATAGLRPALQALEEIANLQTNCPLAAERAERGIKEVTAAVLADPVTHYERVLDETMQRVGLPAFAAALGEGKV